MQCYHKQREEVEAGGRGQLHGPTFWQNQTSIQLPHSSLVCTNISSKVIFIPQGQNTCRLAAVFMSLKKKENVVVINSYDIKELNVI